MNYHPFEASLRQSRVSELMCVMGEDELAAGDDSVDDDDDNDEEEEEEEEGCWTVCVKRK